MTSEQVTAPESENFSPFKQVWRRFFQDRFAVMALVVMLLLFLAAMAAPLIANGLPLLIVTEEGRWFSPALYDFFAPNVQEVFVEKIFNYLLLAALPVALSLILLRKRVLCRRIVAGTLLFLLAIPFFAVPQKNDVRDYEKEFSRATIVSAPVPYGPFQTSSKVFEKPSAEHWFGTDQNGRDVFARMLYGSRVSLAVGFLAAGISLILGTLIGLVSGYLGGKIDLIIQRCVEIVICFPTFLLLLILMVVLLDSGSRQSVLLVILVLGCTGWPGLARLVRGEVLKQRQMQYIQASECMGVPFRRILAVHLLPNVSGPVFVAFAFDIAGCILAENSLSFLGFGVQIPTASWGELLRQALDDPLLHWNLMLWPGLAIFICVCSFHFIADGLHRAIDPKSAG